MKPDVDALRERHDPREVRLPATDRDDGRATPAVRTRQGPTPLDWDSIEVNLFPFGPPWVKVECAYNFTLYSHHAERVTLLLPGEGDLAIPLIAVDLDPACHKTRDLWHCRISKTDARGARYHAGRAGDPRAVGPDSPRQACSVVVLSRRATTA
jgi:hypothetical protein